uniref:REC8 meiotic recombination protein b n=1 Tax=Monopterus albus TaxID=43700 RepID=UPI0009B4954C|nr:meiotic recombination protein REC8 homolog [Monopterus albus]
MFYYPNVLHRHTGCFSTIWLAATRGIKVTRRELLKVDVKQTCGEILDYVTAQVPPPQPNLPRPRFSLYLSSQLQYGVVVVYHKQCAFLLDEVQQAIDRLLRAKRCIHIDMTESDRICLDVPDHLFMMEEAEGAQDPFFGLMESHQLPSPYNIHKTGFVINEGSSQLSLLSSPHTAPDKAAFRSPPAVITMTEKEQFTITTAECFEGEDLPEATARDIDLLMDQPDQFRREDEEQQTEERIRELDGVMSSIDQLRETILGAERDSVWLPDEEAGQPMEVPFGADARELTPLQVTIKPVRGRRRQLVFADPQVQISDREIKQQIGNPQAETRDLSEMLLDLPSLTRWATPAQLFNNPCTSLIQEDLMSLWKKCAVLTVLPDHEKKQRGEEEEESEQNREILRTERKRRHSSLKEISVESGLQLAEGSSAIDVDMSKEDKSVSDVITPVSRWSPQEEAQLQMEPIAEENVEMPEAETESGDKLSWMSSNLQRAEKVTFDSLLPPKTDRTTVAHTFYRLLELLSAGQLAVQQTEPYSHMTIHPAE